MTIRKLRAGRVSTANADTWIGDAGTIFYDEVTGTLKIADGETPGGRRIVLNAEDINLAFGDFVAVDNNLSTVQQNEDLNLISNGVGSINIVGEFHIHTTTGGLESDPIFEIKSDGQLKVIVPNEDNLEGAVSIIGNINGIYQAPVNSGVMLHITGQEGIPSRSYNDALGDYSGFVGRRANGTPSAPTQVLANQEVSRYAANAFTDQGYQLAGLGQLRWYANENQTLNARGGRAEFWVTPNGQTTAQIVARIDPQNGITATQFTGPLLGNVVGNTTGIHSGLNNRVIRNAGRIVNGGTLTIDLSTDSIVTCTWGDGINFAYTNFTAGRVVTVIATKVAGNGNGPINLDGVTASQVSTGSTTVASSLNVTTFIELISTDGSLGGLFVKL